MTQKEFLARLDQPAIVAAIARAEQETSGQIRVHVQPVSRGMDLHELARRTFERLGMTKTAQRNGVLFFVLSEERRFVILGDSGIHDLVGDSFWDEIATRLSSRFQQGAFSEGLIEAIETAGHELREHFPHTAGGSNELSDEIDIEE